MWRSSSTLCYWDAHDSRILAAALAAALAAPAFAQTAPAPAPNATEEVPVAIDTSLGRIVVALDKTHAPVTTANFLHYVDTHRFDGESFYRAMHQPGGKERRPDPGRDPLDALKLYPPIKHEPTSQTGLRNVAGTISMANAGPGTARADFFILASDMPALDATRRRPGFRRVRVRHRRDGRRPENPRVAGLRDHGGRRDEGPDARPAGEDHQGRAGEVAARAGRTSMRQFSALSPVDGRHAPLFASLIA